LLAPVDHAGGRPGGERGLLRDLRWEGICIDADVSGTEEHAELGAEPIIDIADVRNSRGLLPNIALSTTAPKSAYRITAAIATHQATELRELQALRVLEWQHTRSSSIRFLVQPDCAKRVIA